MNSFTKLLAASLIFFLGMHIISSCSKKDIVEPKGPDSVTVVPPVFDIDKISDTYAAVAPFSYYQLWGSYNVHDPCIIKDGDMYYCYSTDVGYGIDVRLGLQIRKSADLVNWQFVGWVFDKLPAMGANFIKQNGATPNNSLWAPYVVKVGSEYRLYYSLASNLARVSVIGLATSTSPTGPWTEKGTVVSSTDDTSLHTNAIDPTVLVDKAGNHWMYYGSAWDGIYVLKLDPATGLSQVPGTRGKRISQRGSTGGHINGNIEGPEIIYNPALNKYYLFIAYDWLQTKYNVRVGKSDTPEGPFYDYQGVDLNVEQDHGPMIIAPYQFKGHGGWQGTSHCSVFQNNNQYFIAHQGRPAVDSYFMDLHVRKLFWTSDGWPVASPERYAATEQTAVTKEELIGTWEKMTLNYHVVPGYQNEQTYPDMQVAVNYTLSNDGLIDGNSSNTWTYKTPWIKFNWNNTSADSVYVERGRDWENKKACLIFTGLSATGTAIWGKK